MAETQMLLNDYSQLPVVTGRKVDGLVSWKSIGKATMTGRAGSRVSDFLDPELPVLHRRMPLLKAVDEIIRHEIVVVADESKTLVGIVTTTDLSVELQRRANAFLLIGSIERSLRRLIGDRFSVEVLRSVRSQGATREVRGPDDLSFGEYLRLLQTPAHWSKLGLRVDGSVVIERLEGVRDIRNAVMHFRGKDSSPTELERLRLTDAFLSSLVDGRGRP